MSKSKKECQKCFEIVEIYEALGVVVILVFLVPYLYLLFKKEVTVEKSLLGFS